MFTFPTPLIQGSFQTRYKRFLADIKLPENKVITAHCANTGAMTSCYYPDCTVFLSKSDNPKRKLAYSWELSTDLHGNLICVNTSIANRFVENVLKEGKISEFQAYSYIRREVKFEDSRLDFLIEDEKSNYLYLEVKSVTLADSHGSKFPDAKTVRGLKHSLSLIKAKQKGFDACLVYVIMRNGQDTFRLASDVDPIYTASVKELVNFGIKILVIYTKITPQSIEVSNYILINH
ncbi:DNA/RNA nuclease SfsA [Glaciecola sp. 1036]|uniref:DNA/RNA nuclease SfsA n=1 Tax=Alteromonadaceae TaxID=72275 RepID=UPI003D08CE94